MTSSADLRQETTGRPRKRLSIAGWLGIGLGGLVAAALGLLLWVTLSAVFKNTTELLNDKSRLFLGALSAQTRHYLDATLAPASVIADEIAEARIDPEGDDEIAPLLRSLLASTPEISALAFFDRSDRTRVAAYYRGNDIVTDREPWPVLEELDQALRQAREKRAAVWGPPIYDSLPGTFLNLRVPVYTDGDFRGIVTALVTVRALSRFLRELEVEVGQNAFILYDRDYVLAHPRLIEPLDGLSRERPLPSIAEIGDPVLAEIWRDGWEERKLVAGSGHYDDRGYVFLYQPLDEYADTPWLVGSYFPEDAIGTQFERMVASGVLSLLIVLLTVAATFLFGRFLRRPIAELADAAGLVRALDFDRVPVLPRSRIAELDDAGRAFDGMVAALRGFSRYVPKGLVARLVEAGDVDAIRSEVKPVTIMMADIVDFTPRAERMSAEETADFLNAQLALITGCIEAEGGIVDKFMGDGVMAHWGAIDAEPDQAGRAVRAASHLRAAITRDNQSRPDPVRLRIGIHSGDVVAGNIGTISRLNYTVVGDAVNMAQRLEALGKTLLPDAEVAILMSAETRQALDRSIEIRSLGFHALRGREAEVEVFTAAADGRPAQVS